MTKKLNNKKSKHKCLKLCALFLFPFAFFGGMALIKPSEKTLAADSYIEYYNTSVDLNNSTFEQGATPFAKGNSLSGWNAIETDSKAVGMLIDVGKGSNTDEGNDTTTFSKNKDDYMLSTNPGAHGSDSRILMINSKENNKQTNNMAFKGYRSNPITLEANSYYIFRVSAKAMLNGDNFANGSIYISGLVDKNGENFTLGYENFTNSTWKEFCFYVATGSQSQTVTVDLYLGTNSGTRSEGAVFFDNVNITRYSNNQFMELCYSDGYKDKDQKIIEYSDPDNWTIQGSEKKLNSVFLLNEFPPDLYIVENTDKMNLNFEDKIPENSDTLGSHWKIVTGGRSNASARIIDMGIQKSDFKELTGFDFVGNDLTYNNKQSLVLWTNNNYSEGYVGVQSENVKIAAHGIYKVSLKLKIAGMESGSFYLKITENENIYSYYPTLISSDSERKDYYELHSEKTSGISANTSNSWSNDYQTVEMYIKGHSLLDTSVNLEFWLGDSSTPANGCVVIDDIMIERSDYNTFSNASNKLEIQAASSNGDGFENSNFNNVQNGNKDGKYPLTASSWTVEKEDENINESGVLYLYDRETYNNLYNKVDENGNRKYAWAGINPNQSVAPNNVYMMFNKKNSYQSITSTTSSISQNAYYKVSFDYYTQDFEGLNPTNIKAEIIDENGIVLFSKNGLSSQGKWSTMEIYIHTAETVTHSVQVKISLGDEGTKVGGLAYLDNFVIESDDSIENSFNSALYKTDLSNYYLNLYTEDSNDIVTSSAYSLNVDEVYDNSSSSAVKARGGITKGNNPNYDIENENNLLVLTNLVACKSTLTSNYKLSLSADTYYELSFDLKTIFGKNAGTSNKDHECHYGFSVTVNGYESINELVSPNELKTYKIFINSKTSSTPTIAFSLTSDCDNSTGTAIITNINFRASNEDEYVVTIPNETIFKATESSASDEPETQPDEDTDSSPSTNENDNSFDSRWLLISSIIMGVALIIAIVGYILRKIKIKKIEIIKKESYDRKLSKNHDVVLAEAQKRRDKEVEDLQRARGVLIDERTQLEELHKSYVKEQRINNNGKLSREDEREFKKYNSDINRLNEKINIIKEKIDYCMTPDYLLTIERKVISEEDEKFNAEKKARKAMMKEMKKDDEQ